VIDPLAAPVAGAAAPTVALPDPDGPYRRRIHIAAHGDLPPDGPGWVEAHLEDDYHRFSVILHHNGVVVTEIESIAGRTPWTTCAAAGAVLQELVGRPLLPRATDAAATTDPHHHCTHMFDIAGLAMSNAARRNRTRRYDVELPPARDGFIVPRLWIDHEPALTWRIAVSGTGARGLVEPEPYASAPWRGGFMRWCEQNLEPEPAEAAIVLRRACDIGMGRGMALDDIPVASDLSNIMRGVCFTMQPEQAGHAFRNVGNIRDFAAHPEALLADTEH
jgi:hypothetical protein